MRAFIKTEIYFVALIQIVEIKIHLKWISRIKVGSIR